MRGIFKRFPLLLLLFLAACAADIGLVKKTDVDTLKQDSYKTKRDIEELRKSISTLQSEISELKKNTPSTESLSAIREGQASLYAQVSELLREVQVLNGRFDENKYFLDRRLKETAAEMEILKSKTDAQAADKAGVEGLRVRVEAVEAELKKLSDKISTIGAVPVETVKPEPQKLYDDALNLIKEKKHAEARKLLEAFLKDFPSHSLAGNAQFWIGEAYYEEKSFESAILAYEEVLEKHKTSPKVPAAMLKQAYAFLELKDKKAAKGILEELIEKYPNSEQAKAASEKIKKIKD